jgi:hypothetical protein
MLCTFHKIHLLGAFTEGAAACIEFFYEFDFIFDTAALI